MPTDLLLPLAGLALLDSTSFGTLLIPLWLMLAPGRLRMQRVLVFLATVAAYYLALGIALLAGATTLADLLAGFLASPAAAWVQLVLGVGLFAASFAIGRKDREPKATTVPEAADAVVVGGGTSPVTASPRPEQPKPGRAGRWRARAMGEGRGVPALMGLALAAAVVETASMVPYLSAIGLLTAADVPMASGALVLAGYSLLMIVPALVLLLVRVVAYPWVRGALQRLEAWLTRTAAETTAWIVGIVGFLLARDAIVRTGLLDLFGG